MREVPNLFQTSRGASEGCIDEVIREATIGRESTWEKNGEIITGMAGRMLDWNQVRYGTIGKGAMDEEKESICRAGDVN